jgi:hypothetical protein
MTTHLGLQRILLPSAQVSQLTTGSITLPSARGAFIDPARYESIQTFTSDGSTNTVTFSAIPQTFTHLQIRSTIRLSVNSISQAVGLRFNGDAGSNYDWASVSGAGHASLAEGVSTVGGSSIFSLHSIGNTGAGNLFNGSILEIIDYTNTNKNTTTREIGGFTSNGGSEEQVRITGGGWRNTAAITSITLTTGDGNFMNNSRIALFGIRG